MPVKAKIIFFLSLQVGRFICERQPREGQIFDCLAHILYSKIFLQNDPTVSSFLPIHRATTK
jgi:hypothetical protein